MNIENAVDFIRFAIEATSLRDEYSVGLRNGLRLALACLTGEEPAFDKFEDDYTVLDEGKLKALLKEAGESNG